MLQVLEPDRAPLLFNMVFGEGVINDATTVALLRTVQVLAVPRDPTALSICGADSNARYGAARSSLCARTTWLSQSILNVLLMFNLSILDSI